MDSKVGTFDTDFDVKKCLTAIILMVSAIFTESAAG